jgi:hypothetical protein
LPQVEVAKRLGKAHSFISKCELGERRVDFVELQQLAKIYNKDLSFFRDWIRGHSQRRFLSTSAVNSKLCISGSMAYDTRGKMPDMADLEKMSLIELEEITAKLRHAIARKPEQSRMEQVEPEDLK